MQEVKHPQLTIRRAEASDTEAIVTLLDTVMSTGGVPRSAAYWRWKHEANPFGPSATLVAEGPDGELAALRTFLEWRWQAGGRTYRAVRPVDTAVHPDWRRRGLFTRLTTQLVDEMQAEGVDFIYNTPNKRSLAGYLKMGWQKAGSVTVWVRVLRPGRIAGAVLGRMDDDRRWTTDDRPVAPRNDNAKGDNGGGGGLTAILSDPALEAFLEGVCLDGGRLATAVDAEYLRWRYHDIPGMRYYAAGAFDEREGAVVFYRTRERWRGIVELRVCDLLVGPGRSSHKMARRLLGQVMRSGEASVATAMAPVRSPAGRVLLRSGFVPVPWLGPTLAVRPLPGYNGPDVTRLSSWGASIGAMELF